MPGPQVVTMADVAARAGVSSATVSRALRGSPGVSPATRQRVRELAADLAYVVSPEASRLAGGAPGRVAVIVHDLGSWYASALLAGLQRVLAGAGLDLLLYSLGDRAERDAFFERLPVRRKVDAVVVVSIPLADAERERLLSTGAHVVVAGASDPVLASVGIDDELAARQAVNHLLTLGHERIGLVNTVSIEGTAWQAHADRERGYHAALAAAGLPVAEELVVSLSLGHRGGAAGMDRLLSARSLPTAVFAFSDEVALGAMRSLRRSGLAVPEQMSVVGLDDHPVAELTDLTTVRQDVVGIGASSGVLLLELLAGRPAPLATVLPTSLVVRSTSAPPRAAWAPVPRELTPQTLA